jgi:hypothetical protein
MKSEMNLRGMLSSINQISLTDLPLKSSVSQYLRTAYFYRMKGKVVAVYGMKAYRGIGGVAPLILNLSTRGK